MTCRDSAGRTPLYVCARLAHAGENFLAALQRGGEWFKALGETEVLNAARQGRVRAVAVRPTWVWGPDRKSVV